MTFKPASIEEVVKCIMEFVPLHELSGHVEEQNRDVMRRCTIDLARLGAKFEIEFSEERDLHAVRVITFPEAVKPSAAWGEEIYAWTFCVEGVIGGASPMRLEIERRCRSTALAYRKLMMLKGKS